MNIDLSKIEKMERDLFKEITKEYPLLTESISFKKYVYKLTNEKKIKYYSVIDNKTKKIATKINLDFGLNALILINQYTLIISMKNSLTLGKIELFSGKIQDYFYSNFQRIIKKVSLRLKENKYFLLENDSFKKDIAICKTQMIPLGAQLVFRSKLPKKIFSFSGAKQLLKVFRIIIRSGVRRTGYYGLTTHAQDKTLMKEFNYDGWRKFYFLLAELLKENKEIKGVCGTSWFFDPGLKKVSPELAYLYELALEVGAEIFYNDSSLGDRKHALFMSEKRQRMFEEGIYIPQSYAIVVSRKNLLKWANL